MMQESVEGDDFEGLVTKREMVKGDGASETVIATSGKVNVHVPLRLGPAANVQDQIGSSRLLFRFDLNTI